MKHWIGGAGLHGYLYQYGPQVYRTKKAGAEDLASTHDNPRGMKTGLMRDGGFEMNLHEDGNEYAELYECTCDTPWDHFEGGRKEYEEWLND